MKSTKGFGTSRALLTTVALCATGVGAQAAERGQIEEVVVTAQKREQALSDVPVSIQALQGAELEAIGVRQMNELISSIPGASEGRSLSAAARSYQIRGIAGYYGDSTVGYYLDDAVFTVLNRNFGPTANAFDVDRVEVLRGPQGTLWGSGAMGGIVRFVTADPDLQNFVLRGNTGYTVTDDEGRDADDNYYANAAISVPVIEDKFAIRAAASYDYQGGYAKQIDTPRTFPAPSVQPGGFPNQLNEVTQENYRVKALFKPTEEFTARLTFQHSATEDPLSRQLVYVERPDRNVALPGTPVNGVYPTGILGQQVEPFADSEYDMAGMYLSYDFGNFALESSTGYLDREAETVTPIFVPVPAAQVPLGHTSGESDTLSTELRLVSQSDGPFNWIVGGIYQDAMAYEDIDFGYFGVHLPSATSPTGTACMNSVPPPPAPGVPRIGPCLFRSDKGQFESESFALFGEVSYALFDGKLIPLVGLRYFEDDKTFKNWEPKPGSDLLPVAVNPGSVFYYETSDTFDSTDGRFNLSYLPSDGVMFYLNVASGFRSGSFNTRSAVANAAANGVIIGQSVDPDQLWSYEVGTKLTFDTVSLELAAYYIDWTDVQLNLTGANQVQYSANGGDVIGEGIDYGINWLAADGLTIQLTGNFNSTELDKLAVPQFGGNLRVGEQLASVPEQTHRIAVDYRRPFGASGLELTFYSSYAFTDKQGDPSHVVSTNPVPGQPAFPSDRGRFGESQENLSARIGVQAENWGVRLVGDNLLGEDDPIQISGSGWLRAYPRTYGLELSFDF